MKRLVLDYQELMDITKTPAMLYEKLEKENFDLNQVIHHERDPITGKYIYLQY